ncbi:TonB-dependent receptor plug domain-containing protein [Acetobacter musti]|uniref:TonB-dependent receptor plug domain-containing protein n=1 Tax=Acetobacter musti TaxID=864732 RepID=A0ABX0JMH2_9PROT|nr:TonB-dependent receptor plug domain-containing protein [Acetobacter musti]
MRTFRHRLYVTATLFTVQNIVTPVSPAAAQESPSAATGTKTERKTPVQTRTVSRSAAMPQKTGVSLVKTVRHPALPATETEQLIVTGTRDAHRTARSSSSPIDIITSAELARTGALNISDALTRTDPSINSSITGGSGVVAGLRMRGLSPNEVLVLVDGKRRHATGVVATYSGPEHGATPVDLNAIPISAIDHIEVLRDGAAAMYGSDAIAGVVNIILKKTPHGLNTSFQTGAHPFSNLYGSPGWDYQLNADGGIGFSGNGYLHLRA